MNVQVIVDSFVVDGLKGSKAANQTEPIFAAAKLSPGSGVIDPDSRNHVEHEMEVIISVAFARFSVCTFITIFICR